MQNNKKLPECIDAYKNALKLDPQDDDAGENLQKALQQLKQQQEQQQKKDNKQQKKPKEDEKKKNSKNKKSRNNQAAAIKNYKKRCWGEVESIAVTGKSAG